MIRVLTGSAMKPNRALVDHQGRRLTPHKHCRRDNHTPNVPERWGVGPVWRGADGYVREGTAN